MLACVIKRTVLHTKAKVFTLNRRNRCNVIAETYLYLQDTKILLEDYVVFTCRQKVGDVSDFIVRTLRSIFSFLHIDEI